MSLILTQAIGKCFLFCAPKRLRNLLDQVDGENAEAVVAYADTRANMQLNKVMARNYAYNIVQMRYRH